jgi:hypothetical protein
VGRRLVGTQVRHLLWRQQQSAARCRGLHAWSGDGRRPKRERVVRIFGARPSDHLLLENRQQDDGRSTPRRATLSLYDCRRDPIARWNGDARSGGRLCPRRRLRGEQLRHGSGVDCEVQRRHAVRPRSLPEGRRQRCLVLGSRRSTNVWRTLRRTGIQRDHGGSRVQPYRLVREHGNVEHAVTTRLSAGWSDNRQRYFAGLV